MLLELQPCRFYDVPHAVIWTAVGRHEPRRGLQQVVILNPLGPHAGLNGSPTGQEDLHVELDLDEEAQLHAQVSIEVRSQGVERRHGQQLLERRVQGVLPEPPGLGSSLLMPVSRTLTPATAPRRTAAMFSTLDNNLSYV